MRDLPDFTVTRWLALEHAVDLHRISFEPGDDADQAVTRTATRLFQWLTGPVALFLTIGQVLDQGTGQPTGNPTKGNPMQLHDTEQVDLSVEVADVKGASIPDDIGTTADDLAWTVEDTSVATLSVSSDTRTCTVVAGLPGSTVGTVTLGELSATFAVDVIPGAAARITISEGTPTEQPA